MRILVTGRTYSTSFSPFEESHLCVQILRCWRKRGDDRSLLISNAFCGLKTENRSKLTIVETGQPFIASHTSTQRTHGISLHDDSSYSHCTRSFCFGDYKNTKTDLMTLIREMPCWHCVASTSQAVTLLLCLLYFHLLILIIPWSFLLLVSLLSRLPGCSLSRLIVLGLPWATYYP